MPNQVRKQSPTSQDSGTSVSLAAQDATVYREKERDGGARALSFIRQRVQKGTLRRLSESRSISGTCSGCRSAWEKVMVVE